MHPPCAGPAESHNARCETEGLRQGGGARSAPPRRGAAVPPRAWSQPSANVRPEVSSSPVRRSAGALILEKVLDLAGSSRASNTGLVVVIVCDLVAVITATAAGEVEGSLGGPPLLPGPATATPPLAPAFRSKS